MHIDRNPFLEIHDPKPLGPGSYQMALPLVNSVKLQPGIRVLEVGAGTGQVAAVLAKHWDVSVVTLEIWEDLNVIQNYAAKLGVSNHVLAINVKAQQLSFADNTFDAVISIGSFEMIGDERPQALTEMVRVARHGARIGIAEPMCLPGPIPPDMEALIKDKGFDRYFRTLEWNCKLFHQHGLTITDCYYFEEGYQWWVDNLRYSKADEDIVLMDQGRWLSLGLVVGQK